MVVEVDTNFSVQTEHHQDFDLCRKQRSGKLLDNLSAMGFAYPSSIDLLRLSSPTFLSWSVEYEIKKKCTYRVFRRNCKMQLSLYEVRENILLFVLNTEYHLRDAWFLRFLKAISFMKHCEFVLCQYTPNCFVNISGTAHLRKAV